MISDSFSLNENWEFVSVLRESLCIANQDNPQTEEKISPMSCL